MKTNTYMSYKYEPNEEEIKKVQLKVDALNRQLDLGLPVSDCSIAWNVHCINVYMLYQKQLLPNPFFVQGMTAEEQKGYRAEWDNVLSAQLYFTPYHFKSVVIKMQQILDTYEKSFGDIAEVVPEGMQ